MGNRNAGVPGGSLISSENTKEALPGQLCLSRLEGRQEVSCVELGKVLKTPRLLGELLLRRTVLARSSLVWYIWGQFRAPVTSQSQGRGTGTFRGKK